jgi:hypothetical protein
METEYSIFVQALKRDVACLSDGDRGVRRAGLDRLRLACEASISTDQAARFFTDQLHVPLCRLVCDQTERIRESAVDLIAWFAKESLPVGPDAYQLCVTVLSDRISQASEPSEEIRIKLVCILSSLIRICGSVIRYVSNDVISALAKSIGDSCPEVKKSGADCAVVLSSSLEASRFRQATHTKPLISALTYNLKHQHWRVRLACMSALHALLALKQDSGDVPLIKDHSEETIPALTAIANDRSVPVREALARSLGAWLISGCIPDDSTAVSFVENGTYCLVTERMTNAWDLKALSLLVSLVLDEEASVCAIATAELRQLSAVSRPTEHSAQAEEQRLRLVGGFSHLPAVATLYADPTVFAFLSCNRRASLAIKQALAVLSRAGNLQDGESARLLAKRLLLVLSPFVTAHLTELVSYLTLTPAGPEEQLVAQSITKAGLLSLILPVIRTNIHAYCAAQNWSLVLSGTEVMTGVLRARPEPIMLQDRECVLAALEEAIDRSPRGTLSGAVSDCAVNLLSQPDDRLFALLLASDAREVLQRAGAFSQDFFQREASRQRKRGARLPAWALLLSCSSAEVFGPHLPTLIIPALRDEARPDSDGEDAVEYRALALEILFALFPRLDRFGSFAESVRMALLEICVPNCAWRPGNANSKIRKASLVCMHQAVSERLLNPDHCLEILVSALPALKSCLDDSWVPDNRLLSLVLIKELMSAMTLPPQELDLFRDLYPELLKRLDDSQDPVRIEACACLGGLFLRVGQEQRLLSTSSVAYILKSLLVHLDDPSEAVASAVTAACTAASASCEAQLVRQEIAAGEARASRPRRFADLLAALSH